MSRAGASLLSVVGAGNSFQTVLTISTGTYAAGFVVGGSMTIPEAATTGGRGYVYSAKVAGQTTANPYELWFFNTDLVTPPTDNQALALVAADAPKFLGALPIGVGSYFTPASGFTPAAATGIGLVVKTTANNTNVITYLKNVAASTGGANTSLWVTVDVDFMD